jgi:hypothetical protein
VPVEDLEAGYARLVGMSAAALREFLEGPSEAKRSPEFLVKVLNRG